MTDSGNHQYKLKATCQLVVGFGFEIVQPLKYYIYERNCCLKVLSRGVVLSAMKLYNMMM